MRTLRGAVGALVIAGWGWAGLADPYAVAAAPVPTSAEPAATAAQVDECCWEWFFLVDGEWRTRLRRGVEPESGVRRRGRWPDGTVERRLVKEPGPGLVRDAERDVQGVPRPRAFPFVDLVLLSSSFERPDADSPSGQLDLSVETVRDTYSGAAGQVVYTWLLDTDADGVTDFLISTGEPDGVSRPLVIGGEGELTGLGKALPVAERVGHALYLTLPLPRDTAPRSLGVAVKSTFLDRDGDEVASDRVPDTGWLVVERYPEASQSPPSAPDEAVAAAVYLVAAHRFNVAYQGLTEGSVLRPEDAPHLHKAVESFIAHLGLLPDSPEVAILVDAFGASREGGTSLPPDLLFIELYAINEEVASAADEVRLQLGLPARTEREVV